MYQFNDKEWMLIKWAYEKYKNIMPIFVQDFMNSFFIVHQDDKKVDNDNELAQLTNSFYFIEQDLEDEIYSIDEEIRRDTEEYDFYEKENDLKRLLNELVVLINMSKMNEIQNCEDRDGY